MNAIMLSLPPENGSCYFGFLLGWFQFTLEHLGQRSVGFEFLFIQACPQREQ